jgi:hypothetical protein
MMTTTTRRRPKSTAFDGTAAPTTAQHRTSLEEGLVAATSDRSAGARLMRRGWRQAVQSAYEQNQAAARVAAAQHLRAVTLVLPEVARGNDEEEEAPSQPRLLQVTYPKGIQGRGTFTDQVDYLPHDLVVATIQSLHPSEALRSSHLALLSPRVFWSLLYHFHQSPEAPVGGRADVLHAALHWSCPALDWSYLRRRPEQLSAKARENRRQQQDPQSSTVDWEAAAAAIADVESAMEHLWEPGPGTTAEDADDDDDDWAIVTPTEEDADELRECLIQAENTGPRATEPHLETMVQALSQRCTIRNWRELANAEAATLYSQLRAALPDAPCSRTDVAAWIDQAQQRSLEEILVEMCDGDLDAVDALREGARSGTPADLAVWESIPGLLWQQLRAAVDPPPVYTERTLQRWCRRARRALEQLEWLADYATPIEDASGR